MSFETDAQVSLWDAVRRVVLKVEPDGPRMASLLTSPSRLARYVLHHENPETNAAASRAQGLIEGWCSREQVGILGDMIGNGTLVDIKAEWFGRRPDYEHNGLIGRVRRIESVALSGADIDRLCREVSGPGPITLPQPAQATPKPGSKPRQKLPAARANADWIAAEEVFKLRCQEAGVPDAENSTGWQTQADVARFLAELLQDRGESAEPSTLKRHAKEMLNKARKPAGRATEDR